MNAPSFRWSSRPCRCELYGIAVVAQFWPGADVISSVNSTSPTTSHQRCLRAKTEEEREKHFFCSVVSVFCWVPR